MARRSEISLDKQAVLAAAFDLLQAEGIEALTMRKLAARLSVQAPALYWHVGDKAQLLGWMANLIYAEARAAAPLSADWRAWLLGFGRALRTSLTARRDAAKICAMALPVGFDSTASRSHAIAEPLVRLGLDEARSLAFQASVISLTLGWSTFQTNGPMHDMLEGMFDFDRAFETGLQALVRGYAVDPE